MKFMQKVKERLASVEESFQKLAEIFQALDTKSVDLFKLAQVVIHVETEVQKAICYVDGAADVASVQKELDNAPGKNWNLLCVSPPDVYEEIRFYLVNSTRVQEFESWKAECESKDLVTEWPERPYYFYPIEDLKTLTFKMPSINEE